MKASLFLMLLLSMAGATDDQDEAWAEETLQGLVHAIDYRNPVVRSEALRLVGSIPGPYSFQQSLAIYQAVCSRWQYFSDPSGGGEYFEKASRTIQTNILRGDCDDFSIAMAALSLGIGGQCRIVVAFEKGSQVGHMYPEFLAGNKNDESWPAALKLIEKEFPEAREINYREAAGGGIWLKMDPPYPGAALPAAGMLITATFDIVNQVYQREDD